jgi:serine protease Do
MALCLTCIVLPPDGSAQVQAEASRGYARQLSAAFREAAKQVLPAVVSVQKVVVPARNSVDRRSAEPEENPLEGTPFEDFFEDFFRDGQSRRFFQPPQGQIGLGSGFIIDPKGIIVTNDHVVSGPGQVRVRLNDGREFNASKVASDERTDLAVVWIEGAENLPVAKLGNSDEVEIGDWVLAIGNPFNFLGSVTAGIISAKGRGLGVAVREDFIQTDAAINPGNSGGPLINLDGEVIAINTAISSRTGGFQGAGFSIPINLASWVVNQLMESGTVRRAYLGTQIGPLTQELSEQFGVPVESGALVAQIIANSPAEKAGLKPGDIIIQFADKQISNPRQLTSEVERAKIGSKFPVTVLRDGKKMTLTVTVEQQPEGYGLARDDEPSEPSPTERRSYEDLGLELAPLSPAEAEQLGLPNHQGVLITSVEPGSPAGLARLNPGTVIVEVNRQAVRRVEDFDAALKARPKEKGILLLVRSRRGSEFVVLHVGP